MTTEQQKLSAKGLVLMTQSWDNSVADRLRTVADMLDNEGVRGAGRVAWRLADLLGYIAKYCPTGSPGIDVATGRGHRLVNKNTNPEHFNEVCETGAAVIRDLRSKYAAARREIESLRSQYERDGDEKTLLEV